MHIYLHREIGLEKIFISYITNIIIITFEIISIFTLNEISYV